MGINHWPLRFGIGACFASLTGAAIHAATWERVSTIPGELTFVRSITELALTCPTGDFESLINRVGELPADRQTWVRGLFTEAWLDRSPKAALAYWRESRVMLSPEIQILFYRRLALSDLQGALAELALEKSPDAANTYKQAIIDAASEKNPAAVLPLARSLAADDSGWLLVRVVASLARTDREAAFAEADKMTNAEMRRAARAAALEVWSEARPADALRWAAQHLPIKEVEFLAEPVLHAVALKDIAEAQRLASELGLPAVSQAMESVLGSLPPKQLCEKAVTSGWAGIPDHALSRMIAYASTQCPAEALRFFKSVPVEHLSDKSSAQEIASAWTLLEPDAVQTWAATIPDSSVREAALLRINTMLTEMDPKLALAQIKAVPPGPLQAQMVSNTAKAFGKKDLPAAIAWIAGLPAGPNQNEALEGLSYIGAEINPAGMIQGLAAMPTGKAKTYAYEQFASKWSKEDVGAALTWLVQLPAGPEREAAQSSVFEEAAKHATDQALAVVKTISDPTEQTALIEKLSSSMAGEDLALALALVSALPDATHRAKLSAYVVEKLADEHPEQAARLAQTTDFGPRIGSVLDHIAWKWASSSPEAAAAWADTLCQNQSLKLVTPSVLSKIANSWADQDADQALAWVNRLPAGKNQDQALIGLARGLVRHFPQKAFDLIANNPTTQKNTNALENLAADWFRIEPAIAARQIEASTLPEPLKKKLLTQSRAR